MLGFTLVEVVMSLAIVAFLFGGIVAAFVQSGNRAEWSGYSLAAQALAIQRLEQARSAKWDIMDTPVVNELTNLPSVLTNILDIPISGTNAVIATNFVTISSIPISTTPLITVQMVQVNTVWPFRGKLFTNTIANYYAPDR